MPLVTSPSPVMTIRIYHCFTLVLLLISTMSPSLVTSQLVGTVTTCDNEGEIIHVPTISDDPCITCICRDGLIGCYQESCPPLAGCHLILYNGKKSEQCCEKCKGCRYRGRDYESGATWRGRKSLCREHSCQAGVVTSSKLRCHVTCRNPVFLPDQCCPVCQGCAVGNEVFEEGATFPAPVDPCATCVCQNGTTICSKRACPVLNCADRFVITQPGSCCPICRGSRHIYDIGQRGCLFRSRVHKNATIIQTDACTNCTCLDGTMICKRRVCPPLSCPFGDAVYESTSCCPVCRKSCKYKGELYRHATTWRRDLCTNCSCSDGTVRCQSEQCNNILECPLHTHLQYVRDQCCPACVEEHAVCAVFGDPHYRTFDGHIYNFQGACTYILAEDCIDKDFSVRVRNEARSANSFAWTKAVRVRIGDDIRVSLKQRRRVKVNRKRVELPYEEAGLFVIIEGSHTVTLKTTFGIRVVWDGDSYVEVIASPDYKNKLCGLCGNYNNIANDDFIGHDGVLYFEASAFGETWRTGSEDASCSKQVTNKSPVHNQSSCKQSYELELRSQRECSALKKPIFASCAQVVDVEPYHRSCLLDMCDCPKHRQCACEALTAYARACSRAGVEIEWRSPTLCGAPTCPKGAIYSSCASACPLTCENWDKPREICQHACRAKCECRSGRVWLRDACVPVEDCPSWNKSNNNNSNSNNNINNNEYENDVFVADNR